MNSDFSIWRNNEKAAKVREIRDLGTWNPSEEIVLRSQGL